MESKKTSLYLEASTDPDSYLTPYTLHLAANALHARQCSLTLHLNPSLPVRLPASPSCRRPIDPKLDCLSMESYESLDITKKYFLNVTYFMILRTKSMKGRKS
jgi:hypothetical protein